MSRSPHFSEEDLIAYQMHESDDTAVIRKHLEVCSECAALSGSIAETLRVFSAGPVQVPDLDFQWERLRGSLGVLTPEPRRSFRLLHWPMAGLALAAMLLVVAGLGLKERIVSRRERGAVAFHRPGPLTMTPTDPSVANHLDRAERLLTEVNHTSGPLDAATRSQAQDLLLSNAVYVQSARREGDLGQASVLEDLGRVLTNIDHESTIPMGGLRVRFELHTDGLLLELRILRQNDLRQ